MKIKCVCLATAVAASFPIAARAATYQVQSDISDYEAIQSTTGALSTSNGVGGDNRVGQRTTSTLSSSILAFDLPAIPAGETINSASLTVTFEGESANLMIEPTDGNIDLYGLPVDPAPFTQEASRYYSGPNDITAGMTKLQDNFLTPAEYPAEATTSTKMSVDIGSYVAALYAAGASPGDFAVIRLSYDVETHNGTNNRYRLVTSGGDGSAVDAFPHTIAEGAPYLSITTVPEPTGVAVLAMGALALASRRRRTI